MTKMVMMKAAIKEIKIYCCTKGKVCI